MWYSLIIKIVKGDLMMKKSLKVVLSLTIGASLLLAGCEDTESKAQMKDKIGYSESLMKQVKTPKLSRSLERENIRQRLIVSNDPLTLQWIYPMSAGRVLGRFPVKGKITSSGKRLTPSSVEVPDGYRESTELADESGAYGSSVEYIFWFDPSGEIHSHRGDFFMSPRPYLIDEGYGTITNEIDQGELALVKEYKNEIKETQERFDKELLDSDKTDKGGEK